MADLIFCDTETISLSPTGDAVWEVAAIDGDDEYVWHLPVDLAQAETRALEINGFLDRFGHLPKGTHPLRYNVSGHLVSRHSATLRSVFADEFMRLTFGKHLVGANPAFDALRLADLLTKNGACPGWHHRLIDVEALALGYAAGFNSISTKATSYVWDGEPITRPISLSQTATLLAIPVPEDGHHTALGDARVVKAVYEAVCGG